MSELFNTLILSNPNLKAYYRMNTGALTTDSSGNSKTLTNNGTIADGVGKYGGGADHGTSSNKYFSRADALGITTGAFAMGGWLKMNAEISSGSQTLISQNSGSGGFLINQIDYDYNGGTRRLNLQRFKGGVGTSATIQSNLTIGTTIFHQIIYDYDGSNIRLYVDGALVGGPTAFSGAGSSSVSDIITIGANKDGVSNANITSDDIFYLGESISLANVQALFRDGGPNLFTSQI